MVTHARTAVYHVSAYRNPKPSNDENIFQALHGCNHYRDLWPGLPGAVCGDPVTSSARTYQTPWNLYQGFGHGETLRVRAESGGLRLSLPLQETKGEER